MPNLGFGELFVLLVLALLIFGPNRLPEIARNLGKAWRVFQDESRKAREVFREAIDTETLKTTAGVIDVPDGATPARTATPRPVARPAPIERAEVDPVLREHEDT